jgi:phosphatidylglycerol---prolipoprotein diacylglyceryl transferase
MTFPLVIDVAGRRLHPHLVFETAAYVVAFALFLRQRATRGDTLPNHTRWTIVAAAMVGGALGARLLFWFEDLGLLAARWGDLSFLASGKTVIGGLLGGLIAVEAVKRAQGITQSTGDLLAVPLAAGIAIGRLGCFFTGLEDQTYGVVTRLPWGVDFGDGVARHPTQLYEVLLLAAFVVALRAAPPPRVAGDHFRVFLVAYLVFRLGIEALKPGVPLAFGLTTLQWACLGGLVYYGHDIRRWMAPAPSEIRP